MPDPSLPIILVADDSLEIQKMVQAALKTVGADLIFADNGDETLEKILVTKPQLVILDVIMPGLSGWEIAKYIRDHEELKDIKILMITGISEEVNDATSPLVGADDHIGKPFHFDDLANRVRKLLGLTE